MESNKFLESLAEKSIVYGLPQTTFNHQFL